MELRNYTPHDIVLRGSDGRDVIIPPIGTRARVEIFQGQPEVIEGIPVPVYGANSFGAVQGLPEPQPNVIYIVSMLVASHPDVKGRGDVVYPGTGPQDNTVRDQNGKILAVTRLIRA